MLRILLFSPKGAGEHYYGPGMNAFRMYSSGKPEDVSITLLHGYEDQKNYDLFDEQVFISEIENKNVFLGIDFLRRAKRWIKQNAHRFDVVHCLTAFHHSFMVSMWFEREGIPVFIKIGQSDHTGFYQNSLFSKLFGLRKYRLKHANDITGYISISREIRDKLEHANIDPDRIHDIPNGVDTQRFCPVEPEEKIKLRQKLLLEDRFTVIFTGAFSDRKNPLLVAKAFYQFSGFKDSQLLLIGPDTDDGDQRQKIQKFIKNNGINNIKVMDFAEKIEDYYQASDLFVLPSEQEGFSNSMLEAQACGLPAIVTKISGAEDLIENGVNGLFIHRETESIINAFEQYFNDRQLLEINSENSKIKVFNNYSTTIILEKYLNLFLLNKR